MTRRQRVLTAGATYARDSGGNFGRRHRNKYRRQPTYDVNTFQWGCSRCAWIGRRDEFEGHRCG